MTDYVFVYTRAQAIEDGVLRDISPLAQEAGFRVPVAISHAAWSECVAVAPDDVAQDETGRLWDVLQCLRFAARQLCGERLLHFQVLVARGGMRPLPVRLKALCGPGDDGEAVITILLPDED